MEQIRENLVFIGEDGQKLRFAPSSKHPITLLGPQSEPVEYIEGVDFVVDYDAGEIKRTSTSDIPDWQKHEAYGLDPFDHREFSNYSNSPFTCVVEYTASVEYAADSEYTASVEYTADSEYAAGVDYAAGVEHAALGSKVTSGALPLIARALSKLYKKLLQAKPIHYVVYGDSISAGYEASRPEYDYPVRFANAMRAHYPSADIHIHRKALAGETSRGGLQRLAQDVLPLKPDLITIGYGMNDQTRMADGSNSLSVEEFEQNLLDMVRLIKERSESEVILLTPCLPNPRWIFASGNVADYAEAIRRVGRAASIPVADVQRLWLEELAVGKSHESLLLNNLNHPNDYGHSLYFAALKPFVISNSPAIANEEE